MKALAMCYWLNTFCCLQIFSPQSTPNCYRRGIISALRAIIESFFLSELLICEIELQYIVNTEASTCYNMTIRVNTQPTLASWLQAYSQANYH